MIATHPFGSTGHDSTRTLFGAAALGSVTQEEADRTVDLLLEHGVNHIDTAHSYGNGRSEMNLGPNMERYRDRFFLATKTGDRTYDGAWAELKESLKRLRVDSVDLIQLHNLTDPKEWETAMGPAGALKAVTEAREQGLVRFIGVTGHGLVAPLMHLKSLERFPFDSVLLPWNYLLWKNEKYRADFMALKEEAGERGAAVQAIKSIARRPWAGRERTTTTWYEPLEDQGDIDRAVSWLLSHEGVFLNTVGDIHVLPRVLRAAADPGPRPGDQEMESIISQQDMALIFSETGTIH